MDLWRRFLSALLNPSSTDHQTWKVALSQDWNVSLPPWWCSYSPGYQRSSDHFPFTLENNITSRHHFPSIVGTDPYETS